MVMANSVSYEKTILYENVDVEANPAPMTTNGVKMQGNATATTSVTEPVLKDAVGYQCHYQRAQMPSDITRIFVQHIYNRMVFRHLCHSCKQ